MSIKDVYSFGNFQLNGDIENFVKEYVDSFVKWDLLVFFHQNPSTFDDAKNIALKLGRTEKEVLKALSELKERQIFKLEDERSQIYSYKPSKENKPKIERFLKLLEDRDSRLQILSLVLKKIKNLA